MGGWNLYQLLVSLMACHVHYCVILNERNDQKGMGYYLLLNQLLKIDVLVE
jgi:hypothetical protein